VRAEPLDQTLPVDRLALRLDEVADVAPSKRSRSMTNDFVQITSSIGRARSARSTACTSRRGSNHASSTGASPFAESKITSTNLSSAHAFASQCGKS